MIKKYKVKNNFFFPSFLLLLILLIYFRAPCIFVDEGHWQIKEDSFYNYSIQNNFLQSILYVYDFGGYFEFARNIITKFATYSPIFSQKISTYLTSIIYLAIFFYIYFSKSLIFHNKNYKIIIIFLILFSPLMTPEIWLTPAHVKAYFGILTFLLILQDLRNQETYKKILHKFVIIFSGLSSIYASAFAPIFFLRFFLEKSKDNFLNFFCSLLPLIVNAYIYIRFSNNLERFSFSVSKIESFSYNILIRPFFGSTIPKFLHDKLNINNNELIFIATFLVIIFCILFIIKVFQKKDIIVILIMASFLLQTIFVMVGSLYPNFVGGRYAVIPGIILLSLFIRFFQLESNYLHKSLFGFLILMSLTVGFLEFKYLSPLPNMIKCTIH